MSEGSHRNTHREGEQVVRNIPSQSSQGIQSVKETLTGGTTHSFTFAAAGLKDMKDADYQVILAGETAGLITVDESTIAATGFDILGGDAGGAEIAHILVHGNLAE